MIDATGTENISMKTDTMMKAPSSKQKSALQKVTNRDSYDL